MQRNEEGLGPKLHKKQGDQVVGILEQLSQGQLHKISQGGIVAFQNQENIRQLHLLGQNKTQVKQTGLESSSKPLKLLVLLLLTIIIQISIQISVLLIQYICYKLSLNAFCILITLAVFLLILVVLSLLKLNSRGFLKTTTITPTNLAEPSPIIFSPDANLPTLINIEKQSQKKYNEKTKKIKQPYFISALTNSHLQTIKKIKCKRQFGTNSNQESSPSLNQEPNYSKVFLTIKLIQNVSIFVLGSICLSTVQNPKIVGITYVVLLIILEFVLIVISSLLAHQVYYITLQASRKEKLVSHHKFITIQVKMQNFIKEENKEPSKPNTALSIEQYLRSQSSMPQMPIVSVQKIKSHISFQQKQQASSPQRQEILLSPAQELKLLELSKKKRNKSVLKANKSSKNHQEPGKDQDYLQQQQEDAKKKVQINFKKIQYFEYDRSSPANSVLCQSEVSQKKSKIRSKYSLARQQRYSQIHEADSVKNGRIESKRRTKSVSQFQQSQKMNCSPISTRSKFKTNKP